MKTFTVDDKPINAVKKFIKEYKENEHKAQGGLNKGLSMFKRKFKCPNGSCNDIVSIGKKIADKETNKRALYFCRSCGHTASLYMFKEV